MNFVNIEKTKKILIGAAVVVMVFTALYFWGEKAGNFFWTEEDEFVGMPEEEDELAGMPCYKSNDIATIEIRGEIVSYLDSSDAYDIVSSEEVISCINNIQNDENIKGVIVEINSRGGSPFASEEIMKALKQLNKPTAAVVRESALSGGYIIASATNKIFASAFSDVGGIGVTMSYLDYSLQDKAEGITYQQISSGKFKDAGDPDKPLTKEEWELFMRDAEIMHEMLVANVAVNRGLNIEKVAELADGSSMLGEMAKENGLIDEIGDINSAENWLISEAAK